MAEAKIPPAPLGAILLALLPLAALYILVPQRNYTDAYDALGYAARIQAGTPLLHPNHLLFEPAFAALHRLAEAVAGPQDVLATMQAANTASGIAALWLVGLLGGRGPGGGRAAALAMAAVGLSYGFWAYALSADTYIAPLAAALGALALLDGRAPPGRARVAGAALLAATAVLLHQLYAVLALLAAARLLSQPRLLAGYLAAVGLIVGLAYLLAYAATDPPLGLADWARGHAREGWSWHREPDWTTPLRGAAGAGAALVATVPLFRFDALAERLSAAFPQHSFVEERFLAVASLDAPTAGIALAAALLATAAVLRLGLAAACRPGRPRDRILLAAALSYAALVLLWEPENREFWIHVLVLAVVWAARRLRFDGAGTRRAALALPLALFAANFPAAIWPMSRAGSDYWLAANAPLLREAAEAELVVTACGALCESYVAYFARVPVYSTARQDPAEVLAALKRAGPGRALVAGWAWRPHPVQRLPDAAGARVAGFAAALPEPAGAAALGTAVYRQDRDGLRRLSP